jgi:hypothetical protein
MVKVKVLLRMPRKRKKYIDRNNIDFELISPQILQPFINTCTHPFILLPPPYRLMDDLKVDAQNAGALLTGDEEVFAWARTVSRLSEMQTREFWAARDQQQEQQQQQQQAEQQ